MRYRLPPAPGGYGCFQKVTLPGPRQRRTFQHIAFLVLEFHRIAHLEGRRIALRERELRLQLLHFAESRDRSSRREPRAHRNVHEPELAAKRRTDFGLRQLSLDKFYACLQT